MKIYLILMSVFLQVSSNELFFNGVQEFEKHRLNALMGLPENIYGALNLETYWVPYCLQEYTKRFKKCFEQKDYQAYTQLKNNFVNFQFKVMGYRSTSKLNENENESKLIAFKDWVADALGTKKNGKDVENDEIAKHIKSIMPPEYHDILTHISQTDKLLPRTKKDLQKTWDLINKKYKLKLAKK